MSTTHYSSLSSHSLIRRAQLPDPQAWRRITRLYGPMIYKWARNSQLQPDDATDVVQDVFQSVIRKLADFEHHNFRGWLWTITRNSIHKLKRDAGRSAVALGGSSAHQMIHKVPFDREINSQEDSSSSDLQSVENNAELVQRALTLIRDDYELTTWQAFWRMTIEGDSASEIAEDLKMTPEAVRQAKFRVLTRLRSIVGHL